MAAAADGGGGVGEEAALRAPHLVRIRVRVRVRFGFGFGLGLGLGLGFGVRVRVTSHTSYLARGLSLSSCHWPDHMIRLRSAGRSECAGSEESALPHGYLRW